MSEATRLSRGLINGYRVLMAREVRGHNRAWLARRLGWQGIAELRAREATWTFWTQEEIAALMAYLDFPARFFVMDDPPNFFENGAFLCHVDPTGEESVCGVIEPTPTLPSPWRETLTQRERAGFPAPTSKPRRRR
jgi:hypothetical protein